VIIRLAAFWLLRKPRTRDSPAPAKSAAFLICLAPPLAACALLGIMAAKAGDLDSIKEEPNLERRSERALANANQAIDAARDAYLAGDLGKTRSALEQVTESVDVCQQALKDTGKNPRRSPKYFKRAELSIRKLLWRLKSLEPDFNVEDRAWLESAERRLQQVHDELLAGIMSKKK